MFSIITYVIILNNDIILVICQVWKVAIYGSTSMMVVIVVFAIFWGACFGIPPRSSSFVAACLCLSSTPLVAKFISASDTSSLNGNGKCK